MRTRCAHHDLGLAVPVKIAGGDRRSETERTGTSRHFVARRSRVWFEPGGVDEPYDPPHLGAADKDVVDPWAIHRRCREPTADLLMCDHTSVGRDLADLR